MSKNRIKKPNVADVLPVYKERDVMEADTVAAATDNAVTLHQLENLEKNLTIWLKAMTSDAFKNFVAYYNFQDNLAAQMIVKRLVRCWLEIEYFDTIIEKYGLTFSYETKYKRLRTMSVGILRVRHEAENQMRQYMDQLDITPKQLNKYKLEKEKLKIRNEQTKLRKKIESKGEEKIDFSMIIEQKSKGLNKRND